MIVLWLLGVIGSVVAIKMDRNKQVIEDWQLEKAKTVAHSSKEDLNVVLNRLQDFCYVQN